MGKYLTVLVFGALLIGLGIGYIFAYGVYQSQNQQLEKTLGELQDSEPVDVNVTNWPPEKPEYQVIYLGKFNITSGSAYMFSVPDWNNPIAADGYTKFSVLYEISDLSPGNYKLNVSVATITWFIVHGPYAQENVQIAKTSLTRHTEGFDQTTPTIDLTEIKAPHFSLEFQTQTDDANWQNIWVVINVYVYLRM